MNRLTDYYKMEKLPGCKSKYRMDCVASTHSYEPFEERAMRGRDKRFKFYLSNTPDTFAADVKRKTDMAITDGSNISSIFTPDLDNPLMGHGNVNGTNDALLFIFSEDYRSVEVFVARDLKNNEKGLYFLFTDGELDEEIARLRQQSTPTNATAQNGSDLTVV